MRNWRSNAFGLFASVAVGGSLALIVLFAVAGTGVAHAQMFKCENDWLQEYDEMELRAAALKVLPKSVHLGAIRACRNPNWARGFIETPKNITVEGVQQWYEFSCQRDAQFWRCEPPEFKQFIATTVAAGGSTLALELSFDKGTSLERARRLASRAIGIYAEPASRLPACTVKEPKESDFLGAKYNHTPLPTGNNVVHVSVSGDANAESVSLDDVDVDIEFPLNRNAASSEGICWYVVIIVT